jgi:Tfp pilus assembly protein PilF
MSRRTPSAAALAALSCLLAAAPAAAQPAGGARVLVVPFENALREPRLGWLAEAAAVLLADELNARRVPAIRRAERVSAFEQLNLPTAAALSRATIIKVGQLLGASEVIVGSYRLDGEDLVVDAHSIRIDVGRLQPHVSERAPLTARFPLFERLAARLAPDAPAPSARAGSLPPLGAFESYIKGLLAEGAATRATFLETAIREFPAFDRARLALWDVRHEQGDHAAALIAARSVPAASPLFPRARFRAGVSLIELKRYDDAYGVFKELLDGAQREPAQGTTAAILNNLGVVQMHRVGAPQDGTAVYYLTKAADADPVDADYQFNLGYAYLAERNHHGAVYWLREAVRRDPADADAHYLLAAALQASGSAVEAAREKDLARQLSSRFEELEGRAAAEKQAVPSGLERLRVDLEVPRMASAEQTIVDAAQRDQQDLATFHLDSGRRLFETERDREAMVELRRAVYLRPYAAEAHLLIGRIHLRAGRAQDAVDALKISIWSEETARARVALAEAYLSMKDVGAARIELERALAIDPQSADARRLLATIR